jgi:hypothetical protein
MHQGLHHSNIKRKELRNCHYNAGTGICRQADVFAAAAAAAAIMPSAGMMAQSAALASWNCLTLSLALYTEPLLSNTSRSLVN